jgi:uncharacterized protein
MNADNHALVDRTAAWVRERMRAEGSHDWFHVERVWKLARQLCRKEAGQSGAQAVDRLVVELAALLHDIADAKFHGGDESLGPRLARTWLEDLASQAGGTDAATGVAGGLGAARIDHVVAIIATMSFRHGTGGFVPDPDDREYAIVRDADRLDAMGAIGIARAFAYGGLKGRPLWDGRTGGKAAGADDTSLGHFYDKLLLLKDLMLTESGRHLAGERHSLMLAYVEQFKNEWGAGQ